MAHVAVYAGSFDPPTNGHEYMIREGAELFEELIVAVGVNPDKAPTFDLETRLRLLGQITADLDHVRVESFENQFLIRYAAGRGARYILRGVRNSTDFGYERTMRHVNEDLQPNVGSVFLIPPRHLAETSSSFVKGLVGPEGWEEVVKGFVPAAVYEALLERFCQ
jgi:pantetheine-phosphate adenylyltransferase